LARKAVAGLAGFLFGALLFFPYDRGGHLIIPYVFGLLGGQPSVQQAFYGALFTVGILFPLAFAAELFVFRRPSGWKSRAFWFLQAVIAGASTLGLHFSATFRVIFTVVVRPHFGLYIALSYVFCAWSLLLAVVPNRAIGLIAFPLAERNETAAG